jgi:hypothetical protein
MRCIARNVAGSYIIALALCAAVFFGCRCSPSKPATDPLAGWTYKPLPGWELPPLGHNTNHLDGSITKDYQTFIGDHHLTARPVTGYFEDSTGQHAVQFDAFAPEEENVEWTYVLIYDKNDKRVKVVKFNYRRYQS